VAGTLFYERRRDPEVIRVDDLVTHFAKTEFMPVIPVDFHERVVHVLPLYKVSSLHGCLQKLYVNPALGGTPHSEEDKIHDIVASDDGEEQWMDIPMDFD